MKMGENFATDLDVLLVCIGLAALVGAAIGVAIAAYRTERIFFSSAVVGSLFGGAIFSGIIGIVAACLVDPWFETIISAPIAFLIAAAMGTPIALLIGVVAGCVANIWSMPGSKATTYPQK